ncbi:hypothetical protein Tco_0741058 [Tanacetum coccineum]
MRQPMVLNKERATSNGFSRNNYDKCVYFKEFAPGTDPARKILGMEIVKDRGIGLCAIGSTLQGSLMYLMVCTRPDIEYAVSIGTADVGVVYGREQGMYVDVAGFVDANYAKDHDKGRLISGYVFMVHEAEYIELTEVVKEIIWHKGLLIELGINPREIVESRDIEMAKIGTKDNADDAFTKVVPGPKFKYCKEILGVRINYEMEFLEVARPGVLCEGSLHWFMNDRRNTKVIVSFDLSRQEFNEIPQPDDLLYKWNDDGKLGFIEESLCIYKHQVPSNLILGYGYDVGEPLFRPMKWMMRNYQVTGSWEQAPYHCEALDVDPHCLRKLKYITHKSSDFCRLLRYQDYMAIPVFVPSLVSPPGNIYRLVKTTNDKRALKRKRRHAKNSKRNAKVGSKYMSFYNGSFFNT